MTSDLHMHACLRTQTNTHEPTYWITCALSKITYHSEYCRLKEKIIWSLALWWAVSQHTRTCCGFLSWGCWPDMPFTKSVNILTSVSDPVWVTFILVTKPIYLSLQSPARFPSISPKPSCTDSVSLRVPQHMLSIIQWGIVHMLFVFSSFLPHPCMLGWGSLVCCLLLTSSLLFPYFFIQLKLREKVYFQKNPEKKDHLRSSILTKVSHLISRLVNLTTEPRS